MSGDVRRIVSNTGPLISLEKLNHGYDFIRQLYEKVIIPPAVLDEVVQGQFENPAAYLRYYGIMDLVEISVVSKRYNFPGMERLHEGEKQAIQLALELQLPLLIEETVGRHIAKSLGIPITGVAGQIVKAFQQQVISATEARNKLSELLKTGRINRRIFEALTAAISEA